MSYRDLRNFTEMMRALGYHRLISMENFRTPNFPLVAEILVWLVNRYDPTADLPSEIDTEQDRVIFIQSLAQFMASKAHIKLNTKKLYMADGYAVKELLKISSLLYSAMKTNQIDRDNSGELNSTALEIANKATDLKACRQLASQITSKGAKLYELLRQEVALREARKLAISRPVEMDKLEDGVQQSVATVNNEIQKVTHRLENLASDEANLEVKIEKKKQELERNQKRLRSLANVRPAFMDEYERLEAELSRQYEGYVEKHCNLAHLEHQLDEYHKAERDRMQETESSLKKVQQRMAEAEKRMIEDELITDDLLLVGSAEFDGRNELGGGGDTSFMRGGGGGRGRDGPRVTGSMRGDPDDIATDDDESAGSLSTGSGLDLDDGEEEGLGAELQDDDDNVPLGSDEDF